jgi:hypothetical protein
MARVPGGLSFPPVLSEMSRACLAAGVFTLLAAPLSAQIGLTSAPRSVSLLATRQPSVTVTVPGDGSVSTEWNVDPAQPLAMTLRAFVDRAVRVPARAQAGGAKSMARTAAYLPAETSTVTVLFTQPMVEGNARGGRQDDLSSRGSSPGMLTLVVTTQ